MAGYGLKLEVDHAQLEALPTGQDPESTSQRKRMFCQADLSGNGILSLAECDRLIVDVLRLRGVDKMKPVINRAFHGARDIVPPVGDFSPHYLDFHEFRYFLIYLKYYLELFLIFDKVDAKDGGYSDRRLSFKEFKAAIPLLIKWGVKDEETLRKHPEAAFREVDHNGGGVVLFDEFAHWALFHHIVALDSDSDADMGEALEVLKKQKPNLCSKDLAGIKADKAKYRVDGPIRGQGALHGDEALAGAYPEVPDGGKELAEGRAYPGGLAGWKASFERADEQEKEQTNEQGPKLCSCGCERPAFSRFATCCTRCKGPEGPHARDCLGKGYTLCSNNCGRLPFGRFETCCTRCKGEEGPHAADCLAKFELAVRKRASLAGGEAADEVAAVEPPPPPHPVAREGPVCEKGCGRPPFRHYKTCCTHCKGADGPHASDCGHKE